MWIGAKQRSSSAPLRASSLLLADGHALRRIVGVRDHDLPDSGRQRRVDRHVDLGAPEVPGREHEVVARDHCEHAREPLRRHAARARSPTPGGRELVLDLPPDRLLGGLRAVLARLVLGVDRRQPDDARPSSRRDLDRLRVEPADAGIEHDRPERIHAGHGPAHDGRALGGRHVVRLEHEARQPELAEAARQREVVDAPLRQVRLDVDVQVVGPAHELARAGRRLSGRHFGQEALPPRAREASP